MDYARPSLIDALAAQYVAGTLRGAARRRFESLLPGHPAMRAAVADWSARLMPLTVAVEPQPPSASVWQAIEQKLWPQRAAEAPPAKASAWRGLGLWRALTGFATVAAVALAVVVANPPIEPPVVVVLQATSSDAGAPAPTTIVASMSGDGRSLVTRPVTPVSLQPDRALELWAVPPKGPATSLGVIATNGTTLVERSKLPRDLLKGGTSALAVSLEPPGGSPTGTATGPIIYVGKLQL